MDLVNRSLVSTILVDLRCFHRTNFHKILPPELYRYLGEFLLPDYQQIPLLGHDLSTVLNLSNNFSETTPWTYKKYIGYRNYNTIITDVHSFNQKYEINVCQATIYNRFSLLKIDFLKVKFGKYYLPIISFTNNNKKGFLRQLEELSLIHNFELFKKKIQKSFSIKMILGKIKKIFKKTYVFKMLTYHSTLGPKIGFSQDCLQELINDIQYFYQVINDSRHNFFKLRHIHYLLPKLIKSFKNCKKSFAGRLGQDVSSELRTEENRTL